MPLKARFFALPIYSDSNSERVSDSHPSVKLFNAQLTMPIRFDRSRLCRTHYTCVCSSLTTKANNFWAVTLVMFCDLPTVRMNCVVIMDVDSRGKQTISGAWKFVEFCPATDQTCAMEKTRHAFMKADRIL